MWTIHGKPKEWQMARFSLLTLLLLVAVSQTHSEQEAVTRDHLAQKTEKSNFQERQDKSMKQLRKQAALRRRRIIFDNDGNEPVYYCQETSAEDFLNCRTTALVGTQVDTIAYCTWSSGFGYFTHDTKVGELFTCREKGFSKNRTRDFIDKGLDPLRIITDFCHQNDLEILWSMRMNDTHDGSSAWYGPLMIPQLKKDHPEYLMGTPSEKPEFAAWTAVDYGLAAVRDLAFRYIEEVCLNYDIDGLQLDFFRHPVFFRSHAEGGTAQKQELDLMTELMVRIREMADEVAVKRGRPILIAVRVPDSVEFCKAIGLDIITWMERDLIDLLVVSGYFRLNPWETSVQLGHQYGIPVYPCLSECRIKGEAGEIRKSPLSYRARAANVWQSGADGVFLFNLHDPDSPLWNEMGDPVRLAGLDKDYSTGARAAGVVNRWLKGGDRFLNRDPISPERPRELAPGSSTIIELCISEDGGSQESQACRLDATLRLCMENLVLPSTIRVKVNDEDQGNASRSDSWLEFAVKREVLTEGVNTIEILLDKSSSETAVLKDLILSLRGI